MIFGNTIYDRVVTGFAPDTWVASPVEISVDTRLSKMTLYVDGNAGGLTEQWLRASVHDSTGAAVATSDVVTVVSGQAASFVDFSFLTVSPGGAAVSAGTYEMLVHAGGAEEVARFYVDLCSGWYAGPNSVDVSGNLGWTFGAANGTVGDDPFEDGPPDSTSGSTDPVLIPAYLTAFATYAPSTVLSEREYANLPYPDALSVLASTSPDRSTEMRASCGWHGTSFAPESGALAIVKKDGILADYVGERVRVECDERVTYAYVYDARDIIEDLSLTRRGYIDLAEPNVEELDVVVTAMTA